MIALVLAIFDQENRHEVLDVFNVANFGTASARGSAVGWAGVTESLRQGLLRLRRRNMVAVPAVAEDWSVFQAALFQSLPNELAKRDRENLKASDEVLEHRCQEFCLIVVQELKKESEAALRNR